MSESPLIIVGASARAAAFSASRSGFAPWWIDQFGDIDLTAQYPGERLPPGDYPGGLVAAMERAPDAPFLFTGAMENHLQVLAELASSRTLLGNGVTACRALRDPLQLGGCYQRAGIAHPKVRPATGGEPDAGQSWLCKPLRGAGGQGIENYRQGRAFPRGLYYLQEFIEGESRAAVYLGNGREACLLGVSRQLVGEAFLNAPAFAYCGSIGPLTLSEPEREQWQRIGSTLAAGFDLQGLFCVDAILRNGTVYPVEVNPRYSASVEVLEMAAGLPVIAMHRDACTGTLPALPGVTPSTCLAKAYLFAGETLRRPDDLREIYDQGQQIPRTADIPAPGSVIEKGQPLMTVFAVAVDPDEAFVTLRRQADLCYRSFTGK